MARGGVPSGLIAFLSGLGLGVAIAILTAPQSGEGTREMLGEITDEGRRLISETVEEFKQQMGRSIEDAADKVEQAVRAGKQTYQTEVNQRTADLARS